MSSVMYSQIHFRNLEVLISMKAWILYRECDLSIDQQPLKLVDMPIPEPGKGEIVITVSCCGVCHTELDEIEGRTPPPLYPVIPGHQVIGNIEKRGRGAERFSIGERVGVAWIWHACGECEFCRSGLENLCPGFRATGRDHNGGYAQYTVVNETFAYRIPSAFSDEEAAPLLCAGAIGYRSLKLADIEDGMTLGLTGFGASGHLVLKLAKQLFPNSFIFVFARNKDEQGFALQLGADWAGDVSEHPPGLCNAIIDTTPVWTTLTQSLLHLKPAGRLVVNAIRKETLDQDALLSIRYQDHLWMEKSIQSVANITRADVNEFLEIAAKFSLRPQIEKYPFEQANEALVDLKKKHIRGAKVLMMP